ncbi:MAG TPA: ATP-binding protein [Longimicrobiales bacterium]
MAERSSSDRRRRPRRLTYERRITLLAVLAGVPGVATALILLWTGDYAPRTQWTFGIFVVVAWWILVATLRERVIRPIQTLANLLAALLEGDYSMRPSGGPTDDALGLAFREVHALGQTLREQRLGALEATALLRKVMAEIDVAVFTFDHERKLRLVNRAGERVLARPAERLLGRTAEELGLAEALGEGRERAGASGPDGRGAGRHADGGGAADGAAGGSTGGAQADPTPRATAPDPGPRILDATFPGRAGRWEVRTGRFRQGGLPHTLLVLTDLSRTLREEERQAWQRLVRVLGHEINNSLAPIKSIAASLRGLLGRDPRPADLDEDLRRGLDVIAARTDALSRFMNAYARLARLPPPRPVPLSIAELIRRVASLETRMTVEVVAGPDTIVHADADQLEQLLINLIKNAVEAAAETGGRVWIGWTRDGAGQLEVFVEDEGRGLPETGNLFVPFFTTKPQGTGIGLVLCRQIAEAHGGTLALANREHGTGCRAVLRLPVGAWAGAAAGN